MYTYILFYSIDSIFDSTLVKLWLFSIYDRLFEKQEIERINNLVCLFQNKTTQ